MPSAASPRSATPAVASRSPLYHLDAHELRALLIAVGAGLLTFLYAMTNEIQLPDNISLFMGGPERLVDTHGRWMLRVWGEISLWQPLRPVGWGFCIASYALAGILVARLWRVRSPGVIALVSVIVTINPGVAHFSRWDIYRPTVSFGYLMVAVALAIAARGWLWAVLASTLVALSMAFHQSTVSFGFAVLFFGIVAALAASPGAELRRFARPWLWRVGMLVGGGLLYVASLAFMSRALGIKLRRVNSDLPSFEQYSDKVATALATLRDVFTDGLTAWPDQLLVAALGLIGLTLFLADRRLAIGARLTGLVLLAGGGLAIFAHQFAMARTVPSGWTPRVAQGLFLIPVIFAVLALYRLRGGARKLAMAACVLVAVFLSFESQTDIFNAHRVSQRMQRDIDRAMARVELDPRYRAGMPVLLAYGYPYGAFHFQPQRPNPYLLHYYGYMTRYRGPRVLLARAQELAREMPLWPDPGSVVVTDELAVIAFDTATARRLRQDAAAPLRPQPVPPPSTEEDAPRAATGN